MTRPIVGARFPIGIQFAHGTVTPIDNKITVTGLKFIPTVIIAKKVGSAHSACLAIYINSSGFIGTGAGCYFDASKLFGWTDAIVVDATSESDGGFTLSVPGGIIDYNWVAYAVD